MDAEQESVQLKLCLYGGKEANIEKSFSPSTTLNDIQHEMRTVFNVDTERETKLWVNGSVYAFQSVSSETANGTSKGVSQSSTSEVKENNGITNGDPTSSGPSSPIKPPPSPPQMPPSSACLVKHRAALEFSSPNVITRQAAQSMTKQLQQQPIALPDSTTVNSMLPTSDSSSKDADPMQTLSQAGLADSANPTIVTLEVVNTDGTWPSSRPRFGTNTRSSKAQPGLCGLSNMGNTCFMNSALQCLSNSPPLTNYILTDKYVDDVNTNNPLGMQGEIARTYAELIKVIWSGNHSSFLPREFKCAVSRFAPQFTGFAQQDCQELMAFLLDGLHEDLNRIKNKPYIEVKNDIEKRPDEDVAKESWENYKKRNDSIVVDTFHAMLKSTLVCPECKLVSVTFDPFCYLSLPLPVKRERQVSLTFLPAPAKLDQTKIKTVLSCLKPEEAELVLKYGGKISSSDGIVEEHAGYDSQSNRPKSCKMQVPRSGPASELCEIVARMINEERPSGSADVKPDNLIVVEMGGLGRISKIYESSEHYNQISDEIVVIEKAADNVLPLYLKEEQSEACITQSLSKLIFLHVPDLKYETLYQTIIVNLSNLKSDSKEDIEKWCTLASPTTIDHQPMECDDVKTTEEHQEMGNCNGKSDTTTNGEVDSSISHKPAFALDTVNSHGNHSFETLGPSSAECDSSKLYLAATFMSSGITSMPQFEHNRTTRSEYVETFTPKVSPKPTLQLKDCITQFTNAERLGADDPWYCPKCKKHQQAIKKFDVWSLPKVLIIHLKRFSFSRSWRDKIDTLVEFPVEELDMSGYVHNPEQKKQPQIYNLIGVANHFGGLGGGHYTAYAKNAPLDAWYSFDDAMVSPTSANNVVTRSAYVLFYQLKED